MKQASDENKEKFNQGIFSWSNTKFSKLKPRELQFVYHRQ